MLLEQLKQKEDRKLQANQERNMENMQLKANRQRQIDMEAARNNQKRMEMQHLANEVKHQAEEERIRKARKDYFSINHMGKHNPITNPIEEHMDNPYILKSYQDRAYHH